MVPAVLACVPFATHSYRLQGSVCWIQSWKDNCPTNIAGRSRRAIRTDCNNVSVSVVDIAEVNLILLCFTSEYFIKIEQISSFTWEEAGYVGGRICTTFVISRLSFITQRLHMHGVTLAPVHQVT